MNYYINDTKKDILLTEEDVEAFKNIKNCLLCEKEFLIMWEIIVIRLGKIEDMLIVNIVITFNILEKIFFLFLFSSLVITIVIYFLKI